MQAYLDNSATTFVSEKAAQAAYDCMRTSFYNPSAQYYPAVKAEKMLQMCRAEILSELNAKNKAEVYFTSGGTEANNLAIFGTAYASRKKHVAFLCVEHPSVRACCEELEQQGYTVDEIPVDLKGQIVWDRLEAILSSGDVSLVSCMQVNNETGAITDTARVSEMIRRLSPDTKFHVDGVQGFLRSKMDLNLCDLYTLSGHKIHAPKGIGALVVKRGVRLRPRQIGGGQQNGVRSGTENTPAIAGLYTAVHELRECAGFTDGIMKNKLLLAQSVREKIPEAVFFGPDPEDGACHIINIGFPGVRGEVMLHALEEKDVFVSTGSACSSKKRKVSPILLSMGYPADVAEGAVRFSLSRYTTAEEIAYAAEVIAEKYEILKKFKRR